MERTFDTIVLGAGPAGVACACILGNAGQRVALIESSGFSDRRIGELLHPDAVALLRRLGLRGVLDSVGTPSAAVLSVWGGTAGEHATPHVAHQICSPLRPTWRVDRRALDLRLAEHAAALGVELWTGATIACARRTYTEWHLTMARNTQTLSLRAPLVVEALGRSRNSLCAPSRDRLWMDALVGLVYEWDGPMSADPFGGNLLVESAPDGWWYSLSTSETSGIAVFLTDADQLPTGVERQSFLREQRQAAIHTSRRLTALTKDPDAARPRGVDARCGIRRHLGNGWWLPVGDNVVSFDPLAGRGFTHALESGIDLADRILQGVASSAELRQAWATHCLAKLHQHLDERRTAYAVEGRWPDRTFWRRRGRATMVRSSPPSAAA